MAKRVIMVCGGKGGVGKSFNVMAVIDFLLRAGETVVLIESDNSNSDVAKCYQSSVQTKLINLETANGWIDFLNVCKANPNAVIVVNTRAANNEGLESYAKMARDGLRKLDRPFVVLWVLNTQRDSVELLHDFIDLLPGTEVHAVKNLFYGRPGEFIEFERSEARALIEASGGQSGTLPVLASYVTDQMYNERLTIAAAGDVNFGLGIEVDRWREAVDADTGLGHVLAGRKPAQAEVAA
jgi:CobQ/CobB/MinD/ParA nucleotide binding domain